MDEALCKAKAVEESGETYIPVHLPGDLTSLPCYFAGFIFGEPYFTSTPFLSRTGRAERCRSPWP
jgi:hypothetical protein